jgi:hypothetical protein
MGGFRGQRPQFELAAYSQKLPGTLLRSLVHDRDLMKLLLGCHADRNHHPKAMASGTEWVQRAHHTRWSQAPHGSGRMTRQKNWPRESQWL